MSNMNLSRTSIMVLALCAGTGLLRQNVQAQANPEREPVTLSLRMGNQVWQIVLRELTFEACNALLSVQPPDESDAEISKSGESKTGSQSAEVVSDEEFVMDQDKESGKVLQSSRPEWVGREPDYSAKDHYLSVGGIPSATYELSEESLEEGPLMNTVSEYLIHHVLEDPSDEGILAELDNQWIKANLLVDGKKYDSLITIGGDKYHMAWRQLKITERHRKMFLERGREARRQERLKQAAGTSAFALGGLGMVHLMVSWMARRKTTAA